MTKREFAGGIKFFALIWGNPVYTIVTRISAITVRNRKIVKWALFYQILFLIYCREEIVASTFSFLDILKTLKWCICKKNAVAFLHTVKTLLKKLFNSNSLMKLGLNYNLSIFKNHVQDCYFLCTPYWIFDSILFLPLQNEIVQAYDNC